jgi:hypothetical protein
VASPEESLELLAGALRADETLLADHLRPAEGQPALGILAAAGPRAEGAEADYAFIVEAVREGYLLHYDEPRLLGGVDPGLALLAGDYLYALGLECLAGLGDLDAVRELAGLISLSALIHADGPAAGATADALWLASATAVTVAPSEAHQAAKEALRRTGPGVDAARALARAGRQAAAEGGFASAWERAAGSIDFDLPDAPARG